MCLDEKFQYKLVKKHLGIIKTEKNCFGLNGTSVFPKPKYKN